MRSRLLNVIMAFVFVQAVASGFLLYFGLRTMSPTFGFDFSTSARVFLVVVFVPLLLLSGAGILSLVRHSSTAPRPADLDTAREHRDSCSQAKGTSATQGVESCSLKITVRVSSVLLAAVVFGSVTGELWITADETRFTDEVQQHRLAGYFHEQNRYYIRDRAWPGYGGRLIYDFQADLFRAED